MIRYLFLVLTALWCTLTGFARAADSRTIEKFYNLSPGEFENQIKDYYKHDYIDSAILCANIQASKYGKNKLTVEEAKACCTAFRYRGLIYLWGFYDYQNAFENYLKAEQIADKYGFERLQNLIAFNKAVLIATRNNLENTLSIIRM